MNTMILIPLSLAMIAVLATLALGLVAMTRGGEFNQKYGNKLMRLRVVLQGIALILFAVALLSNR